MTTELSRRSSPEQKRRPELTPEESALVLRIGVFVVMRWIAIAGILLASLLATQVFNISFPLLPVYIICAIMAGYNFVLLLQARGLKAEASGSLPQGMDVPLTRLLKRKVKILLKLGARLSPLLDFSIFGGETH